jgi:glycosyltransferase involved in cell wall biosynthesis
VGFPFSFLLNTRNKLAWLEESVPRLLKAKGEGYEVVVVDAGSSDGSADYLRGFHQQGQIDQFLSEPDCGEAHGWNKGLLLCRGRLIKLITDDDVFDYAAVERCLQYMERSEEIDLLVTPAVNAVARGNVISAHHLVCGLENEAAFLQRREMNTCGLGIVLRKRSIPLLGLFNTQVVWIDYEFLIRAMHARATIAWFSDPVALRIHNPDSISARFARRMSIERKRLEVYYGHGHRVSLIDQLRGLKHTAQDAAARFGGNAQSRRQRNKRNQALTAEEGGSSGRAQIAVRDVFDMGERILAEYQNPHGARWVVSGPDHGVRR